jgi:hypothetical protein
MSKIESKLDSLKQHLESAAFLVSRGESEKEAHAEIVRSLIIVSELKSSLNKQSSEPLQKPMSRKPTDVEEVRKVNRRLKLWAGRQSQINSKILNAFLKLKRSGLTTITEAALRNELPQEKSFESNFAQMKIIAPNNHGKVFEQYGENISIWDPVVRAVKEYEEIVIESR